MKLSQCTALLLTAALWLEIARSEVRCALRCGSATEAHQLLSRAKEDAARFRSTTALWWRVVSAAQA